MADATAYPLETWKLGDIRITKVVEQEVPLPLSFLIPEATDEAVRQIEWLDDRFVTPEAHARFSIGVVVIETPTARIVVDGGFGNGKTRTFYGPQGDHLALPLIADLEAAGYPVESIDFVVCSHIHPDHAGGLTTFVDGVWVPTFPNARYVAAADEYAVARGIDGDDPSFAHEIHLTFEDSIEPIERAGKWDLVSGEHVLADGVRLVPTPGHSPGHLMVEVESRGEKFLLLGDVLHHPAQLRHLEWVAADADPEQARGTRESVVASVVDTTTRVLGAHWARRGSGRIARDGSVYKLIDLGD